MKQVLSKLWQHKWIPIWFFMLEALVLLPFWFFVHTYGQENIAYNLEVTPFGSTQFTGFIIESLGKTDGPQFLILLFVFTLPLFLMTKLALAAGSFHAMQTNSKKFSDWLSGAGEHFIKTLALFLRWIPLVVIWMVLCGLLMALEISWLNYLAMALMVTGWFLMLSWFNYALIEVVQHKKKSLRTGFSLLKLSVFKVAVVAILFVIAAALINLLPIINLYVGFSDWGNIVWVTLIALITGILLRTVVFMWQIAHFVNYRKLKEFA